MRILIVDDDQLSLTLLENALTQAQHEVQTACNGQEALAKLRRGGLHMVISDWDMPVMSGEELCRQVRAEAFGGYVYFILLTAHDSQEHVVQGLDAGADDFIAKPFNPAELTVRVRAGQRVLALETRDVALFAMAKLAESRDPETGHHLERVRNYCRTLAQCLLEWDRPGYAVTAAFVQTIYSTSPLHDVGKIGIPDSILLKPGRLSDREFSVMKGHTTLGAETLNAAVAQYPSAEFLLMARDIAASHHERFDGTGYPAGLVGENIPLSARILALADVYDALTSRRVYKNAYSHEVARSIIVEESGSHFDPVIVKAFIETEATFLELRNRLSDFSAQAA